MTVATAGDSSVGRASDYRALQLSDGPWFDSGSPDVLHSMLPCLDDVTGLCTHVHVLHVAAKHCAHACQKGRLRALMSQNKRQEKTHQYPLASLSARVPDAPGHMSSNNALSPARNTMFYFASAKHPLFIQCFLALWSMSTWLVLRMGRRRNLKNKKQIN